MAGVDTLLAAALQGLPPKPSPDSKAAVKKRYSEQMSAAAAHAVAEALRERGMTDARPAVPGEVGLSGAERRLAGGIGAKRVDVSWATEESGLVFAASIKSINWRDGRSQNFQKNLTNRRGDMLFEAVTLHRRFPYAVLAGLFFLDKDARFDDTTRRRSTFDNAFPRLRLFTDRGDPGGRPEQLERLYVVLVDATPLSAWWECYHVNDPMTVVPLSDAIDDWVHVVAERNFDFYEASGNGTIRRTR